MRYLTFALGKGRLAKQTLELFEKIGITCEEMKDKDSRKLIFTNEELKLRFFLAKGPDVPTYVEYGAADIGVVGKDTILEEGRKVHEVLDLGFGKCKMCVCGFPEAKELLRRYEGFLEYALPLYVKEGKSQLTIAVGCTGGKHRSVAIAEALSEHLRGREYGVVTMHRDYQR